MLSISDCCTLSQEPEEGGNPERLEWQQTNSWAQCTLHKGIKRENGILLDLGNKSEGESEFIKKIMRKQHTSYEPGLGGACMAPQ